MSDRNISVYRVGVLQSLFMDWRRLTMRLGEQWWVPAYLWAEVRMLWNHARRGNWRAVDFLNAPAVTEEER